MSESTEGKFWYCLKHHAVEPTDGCNIADRLGPYPTREEAERALEKVAERNAAWDNDPNWNDDLPEKS
ncbi:MAG: hypothetical protein QM638_12405 [Nocardioides sp.]|uniref:SPOR domain-containing protein n=1 Tax=Nocardioides sp. TaxID=35761 RepID=UPI0039E638E5